jgi:hypothetical protein
MNNQQVKLFADMEHWVPKLSADEVATLARNGKLLLDIDNAFVTNAQLDIIRPLKTSNNIEQFKTDNRKINNLRTSLNDMMISLDSDGLSDADLRKKVILNVCFSLGFVILIAFYIVAKTTWRAGQRT